VDREKEAPRDLGVVQAVHRQLRHGAVALGMASYNP
jgi:hypothetical protein